MLLGMWGLLKCVAFDFCVQMNENEQFGVA